MRGFWIDERIEWDIWKKNALKYNLFKYIESKLINNANAIVSLTSALGIYTIPTFIIVVIAIYTFILLDQYFFIYKKWGQLIDDDGMLHKDDPEGQFNGAELAGEQKGTGATDSEDLKAANFAHRKGSVREAIGPLYFQKEGRYIRCNMNYHE